MPTKHRLLSLEEFLALPEEKPYLELIDGEVCQKPVGKTRHSRAQTRLSTLLSTHPATRGGEAFAELGMHYWSDRAPRNHRVPDISYYRPGRRITDPYPDQPPDLGVEVLSEGQSRRSVEARLRFLREQGVPATLLIDPEAETVEVTEGDRTWLAGRDDEVHLDSLDGFSFRVADLFA